ncbi:hypothetical protein [Lysobacter gummosus]|uniref:hypothetical protein n=1 Tax=Lysobacter gummosus TaxID=262324 RepID=UPI00362FC5F7
MRYVSLWVALSPSPACGLRGRCLRAIGSRGTEPPERYAFGRGEVEARAAQ